MRATPTGGLRSDGERAPGVPDFFAFSPAANGDKDHRGWIDLVSVGGPLTRSENDPDDDNGLPDTIIWCIDGDGSGTDMVEVTFDIRDRSWSVDGVEVDDAGMSALLVFEPCCALTAWKLRHAFGQDLVKTGREEP
jgi:hypothetical protein